MDGIKNPTIKRKTKYPIKYDLGEGTDVISQEYNIRMDSSDSEDEHIDEFSKFQYVRRGNQIIEIRRYTGGRIISRFEHIIYSFGGSFIPPGQYSFPFRFKTGEDYPASFSVSYHLLRINLETIMLREE